ncbi:hypothetical protein R1sor_004561 [Riccia sorocarpa]|uniref:Uncharacterized protein n=1 Tax=Riccia sorocarpa TaxID=122646 RepID=A0ABD3HKT8_9MARC
MLKLKNMKRTRKMKMKTMVRLLLKHFRTPRRTRVPNRCLLQGDVSKRLFVKRNHQGLKLEIAGNDDQAKWTQPADGKYHLPNNFTKKEVYDHYKTDMVQVPEAVQALKLHKKQQAEERAAAGRRRWKALDSPKDCAYIQIDGMDQKKTALPHFFKQPE